MAKMYAYLHMAKLGVAKPIPCKVDRHLNLRESYHVVYS